MKTFNIFEILLVTSIQACLALYHREIFKYKTHAYKNLTGTFSAFICAPIMSFLLWCCHFTSFFLVYISLPYIASCWLIVRFVKRDIDKCCEEVKPSWFKPEVLGFNCIKKKKWPGLLIKKSVWRSKTVRGRERTLTAFPSAERRRWHFEKYTK